VQVRPSARQLAGSINVDAAVGATNDTLQPTLFLGNPAGDTRPLGYVPRAQWLRLLSRDNP